MQIIASNSDVTKGKIFESLKSDMKDVKHTMFWQNEYEGIYHAEFIIYADDEETKKIVKNLIKKYANSEVKL